MIVTVAGRRIDAVNAKRPQFPLSLVDDVKSRLRNKLASVHATHVITSGACGTDLLALETAVDLGIPATMIIPFDIITFKSKSVTDRPGKWGEIYDKIVSEPTISGNIVEMHFDKNDSEAYHKTNLLIIERAQEKSQLASPPEQVLALIVWEGKVKNSRDATYHFMLEANKRNFLVDELKL